MPADLLVGYFGVVRSALVPLEVTRHRRSRCYRLARVGSAATLVALIAMGGGCSGGHEPLLPGDAPVEHAIHSERLRAAMVELERLTLEELPGELDARRSRAAKRDEVIELADRLADAAAELPRTLGSFELPPEAAPRFFELSERLRRDALALKGRAATGELRPERDEIEIILGTCNACHAEMRIAPSNAAR